MYLKKILISILCVLIFQVAKSQFELATGGGLCSSVALEKRDTFEGTQSFTFSVVPNFFINENTSLISSIKFANLKTSNKFNAEEIVWQTTSLNIGAMYFLNKNKKLGIYALTGSNYLIKHGKNVLSQSSPSGTSFVEIKHKNKFLYNTEFGLNYYPKEYLIVKGGLNYVFFNNKERYKVPASIELSIFYRFKINNKNNIKPDTAMSAEKAFCNKLHNGILYIIENRKDSSFMVLRDAFNSIYNFSRKAFVDQAELKQKLDSFNNAQNFESIFIAKCGTIVYDISRSATNGIIIYNYQMQNPIEGKPIFVRNLSYDSNFENKETTKRIVKKLNQRLYSFCNNY